MIPMTKNAAIKKIKYQISLIGSLNQNDPFSEQFENWRKGTEKLLSNIFANDSSQLNDFIELKYKRTGVYFFSTDVNDQSHITYFKDGLEKAKGLLEIFVNEIEENWKDDSNVKKDEPRVNLNDVVELRPNFMGLGVNINAIIKKYFKKK